MCVSVRVCFFLYIFFLEGIGYYVQSAYRITRHPPALHNPVFGNIEHNLVELRSHSNSTVRVLILELGLYFKINVLPVSACHACRNLPSESDWAVGKDGAASVNRKCFYFKKNKKT